jgi:beta-lactamase superfamily II metal-dependent hydrolase
MRVAGIVAAFAWLLWLPPLSAQPTESRKALQIYFVDVEGGQATLFITPTGQSMLIDTGWPGNEGRDADRIVSAARNAGLSEIDYVLVTHFHEDHVGGVPQLAAKIPIGMLIDHGVNREQGDAHTEEVWQAYLKVVAERKLKRMTAKVGDALPITGIETLVVSSDGELLKNPLPGAGEKNPACAGAPDRPADQTENPRSLGTLFTFGKLRILDLGDLTSDKEMGLVCPVNKLGLIDIYIVSHHGWVLSNSREFLQGIAPRVAIMDNGAKKGGTPAAWDIIEKSPRLAAMWQLHYAEEGGEQHNAAEPFLANLKGPDTGNFLKLTAWPDGKFEVFNSRTQTTKEYEAKR